MKLIFAIALLGSSSAFASTIDLPSGSQIVINAGDTTLVRCAASANPVPLKCTITQISSNCGGLNTAYTITQGGNLINTYCYFSDAVSELKELQKSLICP